MGDQDNQLSNESKGRDGEIIRDYVPKENVSWRWGRPNYARVNDMYFKHRTKKPVPGTLEELVTRVVKNWEVDSHHVAKAEDWVTIDQNVFKWRHFGKYSGTYEDAEGNKYKGDGRMFELIGTVVATLNANAKIEELEVFYNPDDMIVPLTAPELLSEAVKKPEPEQAKQDCSIM